MTLHQLTESLSRRELRVSDEDLNQCLPRLSSQTCITLSTSWNPRVPRGFRSVERMVTSRSSPCRRVFGE